MSKNYKVYRHPERSEGSGIRFFGCCPQNDGESGRSMVEMLGVLAVMGGVSFAGIAGYKNAMNKYRANELLNEASKRAVVATRQAMEGRTTVSLAEFSGHSQVAGATFVDDESVDISGNTFAIKIKGVDSAVCTQMKNSIGSNTVVREIPETCGTEVISLVFNKDLSKSSPSSEPLIDTSIDNQEDCQEAGKTWCYASTDSLSNGVCSNVTDCCKTVTLNSCQTCQMVSQLGSGSYTISDKLEGAKCDYDGDGNISDGVCSSGTCTEGACTNCCEAYSNEGVNALLNQAGQALQEGDFATAVAIAEQANTLDCTRCDSTTGNVTSESNYLDCQYADVSNFITTQEFLGGYCLNGKCVLDNRASCSENSECSDSGDYCKITADDCSGPSGGKCTPKGNSNDLVPITLPDGTTVYASNQAMTWWAAEQYCAAHGMQRVSKNVFTGINAANSTTHVLYNLFNAKDRTQRGYWLNEDSEDACFAGGFYVWDLTVDDYYESCDKNPPNINHFYALCRL